MRSGRWYRLIFCTVVTTLLMQVVPSGGRAVAAHGSVPVAPFSDIVRTRYQDAVGSLYALGIVEGVTPGTFAPGQPVTRAEFISLVLRALNIQSGPADITSAFADVPSSYWAAASIGRGRATGLATGTEGRFQPEEPVTYAEVITVLVRAAGYETPQLLANWPAGYVLRAQELGLLQDTQFSADLPAYRGEVAIMLMNFIFRTPMAATGQTLSQTAFRLPADVQITPDGDLITSDTVNLGLQGLDWFGMPFPLDATWRVIGGNGYFYSGSSKLILSGPGPVTVEGSAAGMTTQRTFHTVKSLTITAASVPGLATGQFQMQALGVRDDNVTIPLEGVRWSASGPGSIDRESGLLTLTGTDPVSVTAIWGNVRNTVQAHSAGNANGGSSNSTAPPPVSGGTPSLIRVSPSATSVAANGSATVTVTARITDALGNSSRAGVGQLFFSLATPALGSLSAYLVPVSDGQAQATFTAGRVPGTQVITVTAPPGFTLAPGSAAVTLVAPAPTSVVLSATPATLAADGVSQTDITGTLLDQTGQPLANSWGTFVVPLAADSTAAGVLLDGVITIPPGASSGKARFRASAVPGTTIIRGTSAVPVQPVQVATVFVGPPAQLAIQPSAASSPADGSSVLSVRVEIQDATGNVETGDNTSVIGLMATGPSGPVNLGNQVVRGGASTFQLTRTVAGQYTLTATLMGNTGITPAQTSVSFTAGPATRLSLTPDPSTGILSADFATVAFLVAQVQDAGGNAVSRANIPVTFTKLTSNGVVQTLTQPTIYTSDSGEARLAISPTNVPGSEQFKAAAPGLPDSPVVLITTQATGPATAVRVQPPANNSVVAGQPITVRVYVVDSAGRLVTGNAGTPITLSGSAGTRPQGTRYGVATFTVLPATVGNLTLRAQAPGLQPDTLGVTLAVTAGPTDHLELRASTTAIAADGISQLAITPVAVDAAGNPTGQYFAVNLALTNGAAGLLSASSVVTGGNAWFRSAQTAATVQVIGVAAVPVTPLTITTYVAGTPSAIVLDPVNSARVGNSSTAPVTITARVVDQNGRTVTALNSGTGGVSTAVLKVTTRGSGTSVSVNGLGYPLPPATPVPDGRLAGSAAVINGVATFTFADSMAETVTLTPALAVNGVLLQATPAQVAVGPGDITRLSLTATPAVAPTAASSTVTITASLQDAFGNRVPTLGDAITFGLNTFNYLVPTGALTVAAGADGTASITLITVGAPGVTSITATSALTGRTTTQPLFFVVDQPPVVPAVSVTGLSGPNVLSSDAGFQISISTSPRITAQQLYVYLNGAQVPVYADLAGTTPLTALPANATSVTGYVLRANFGGSGARNLWVVAQNAIGTSGPSNQVLFTIF